jgi:hypothetical protein
MKFVEHRVGDKRVLRLIRKWLSAGVVEEGRWRMTEDGTPQGATISPLLANIYLHYAFDLWAARWRKSARGDVIITRYADDFIVGFSRRGDASRFERELEERLRKFSLELHPEKTRRIEFGPQAQGRRQKRGAGKAETFDFLGFTHISGNTKSGGFQLRRQTIAKRMRAKLQDIKVELNKRRHLPLKEQGKWLGSVMRGYFAYHAVPTNSRAIRAFRNHAQWLWLRALRLRSERDRTNWGSIEAMSKRWLPKALIQHEWPNKRFDVKYQGKSRVR